MAVPPCIKKVHSKEILGMHITIYNIVIECSFLGRRYAYTQRVPAVFG